MRSLLVAAPIAAMMLTAVPAAAAAPVSADQVIVLPGATSAEGIAAGHGTTFYAGDLFGGDIFRGDIRRGRAALFIDAPAGRAAVGMAFKHDLLFVAGGTGGKAYVYDTRTRASVAEYTFTSADSFVNDVALTPAGAWFTDSVRPALYFVPVRHGVPGPARTLTVTGPAAEVTGAFNLNGIAAPSGRTLIVAHSALGKVYTVDPVSGASAAISGVDVPNVDGLVLSGRTLWAVQNFSNQIGRYRLGGDLRSGSLEKVITSTEFHVPTTAALFGHRLAAVNSHFDTGVPPTAPQYEVIVTGS